MKVEKSSIRKYKIIPWYDKSKNTFFYGVNVVMVDGKSYHVHDNDKPLFYNTKSEARKKVIELNKLLKTIA